MGTRAGVGEQAHGMPGGGRATGVVAALWEAAADLVWGSACVGCARPGRSLCTPCAEPFTALPFRPRPSTGWGPDAPGLHATAEYGGSVRAAVIAHKERSVLSLATPLGDALALSVLACVAECDGLSGRLALVPVPSSPATVRARGHDPLGRITRRAATALRAAGVDARQYPALRLRRVVVDQAALDAEHRRANVAGAFAARSRATLAGLPVVVVDDVVTTGSTARRRCGPRPRPGPTSWASPSSRPPRATITGPRGHGRLEPGTGGSGGFAAVVRTSD